MDKNKLDLYFKIAILVLIIIFIITQISLVSALKDIYQQLDNIYHHLVNVYQ